MSITLHSRVADIATENPAAIEVFQQHQIDFCCGGHLPLEEACRRRGVDPGQVLAELQQAPPPADDAGAWQRAPLSSLVTHIQQTYHAPLRAELARLDAMMARVLDRHGERHPDIVPPLASVFARFRGELLDHMVKEDTILFPAIVALEHAGRASGMASWISQPMAVMEAEHDAAGEALAAMRQITHGYAPPEDACPTFRGLYHGLAELEREMHLHVHLENNILFPRAERLAGAA